jgi:amidohydrolase
VEGRGGHAAMPHETPDAILAASELVGQLNTLVSRRIPPMSSAVLSVTQIAGGSSHNVLPSTVRLQGTVRTFDVAVQDRIEKAMNDVARGVAQSSGTHVSLEYKRYYPATINHAGSAAAVLKAAANIADTQLAQDPAFTSEDFGFMLQACEGAYIWLGQGRGEEEAPLHNPRYDFNDGVLGTGIRLHVSLVEHHLPI